MINMTMVKNLKHQDNSVNKDLLCAKAVFNSAIDGINNLVDNLDDNFIELVNKIYSINGRVIISGMGKSGHIARKISSTLASTGTASFYVHPGEASHGDLGMITKNDLVILLSNSGETNELKDIINYVKRYHIPLACFVRKKNSSLAEASDIKIIIPAIPEALEFDAPTTSTTMMLVLGDALAITLLQKRGFTRDDFQVFHPGGRLGASFIKIKDIMHMGNEIPITYEHIKMPEVIEIMTAKSFGCIAVLDSNEHLVGIITDGNLRRHIFNDILVLHAKDVMTRNPITIKPNSMAVEALDLMNNKAITNLLVTEEQSNKLVGIVHMHDCLRSGVSPK